MVNISMLIISTIWFTFDLSVSNVPRPCLYMLGLSSLTWLFRMCKTVLHPLYVNVEPITPDHHVVSQHKELSQWCIVRGNTSLKFCEGSSCLYHCRSKQIRCKHDKHHMQFIKWHDMANHLAPLISIFEARHDHHRHRHDTMISIIVSSWSCLANYYFYYYG